MPKQNGVVERKNQTVQEMVKTMMNDYRLANHFLKEVIHIIVYIQNRCMLRVNDSKMPYELWFEIKAYVKYF